MEQKFLPLVKGSGYVQLFTQNYAFSCSRSNEHHVKCPEMVGGTPLASLRRSPKSPPLLYLIIVFDIRVLCHYSVPFFTPYGTLCKIIIKNTRYDTKWTCKFVLKVRALNN